MENPIFKHRAVTEFLTKKGEWAAEFNYGRDWIEDDPRYGRPVEVVTDEVCDAVEKLVMDDRRIKVREIAVAMGISIGCVE